MKKPRRKPVPATCTACGIIKVVKPGQLSRIKLLGFACSKVCSGKLRETGVRGKNNPNYRYAIDPLFLSQIDTAEKAYLLGWIASDGTVRKDGFGISLHVKDLEVLRILSRICGGVPVKHRKKRLGFSPMATVSVHSSQWAEDICRHLKIVPGKKSHTVSFPDIQDAKLRWVFLRGYFEGDGCIVSRKAAENTAKRTDRLLMPRASIASNSQSMLLSIRELVGTGSVSKDTICWSGVNCMDFLDRLYPSGCQALALRRKLELFENWACWIPAIGGNGGRIVLDGIKFHRTCTEAFLPQKVRWSDTGYDLTLIKKLWENDFFAMYDTGIKVRPPIGFYFDLISRSSLIKKGYMMGNGTGVIDQSFIGNILVPLIKVNPSVPDLELPCRAVQLVLRPIYSVKLVEVQEFDTETDRGAGGFGSSDKQSLGQGIGK